MRIVQGNVVSTRGTVYGKIPLKTDNNHNDGIVIGDPVENERNIDQAWDLTVQQSRTQAPAGFIAKTLQTVTRFVQNMM